MLSAALKCLDQNQSGGPRTTQPMWLQKKILILQLVASKCPTLGKTRLKTVFFLIKNLNLRALSSLNDIFDFLTNIELASVHTYLIERAVSVGSFLHWC